jgi:hypothetical protein
MANTNIQNDSQVNPELLAAVSLKPGESPPHLKRHAHRLMILYLILIILVIIVGVFGYHNRKTHQSYVALHTKYSTNAAKVTITTYTSWDAAPKDVQGAVTTAWQYISPAYKTSSSANCNSDISKTITVSNPIFITENKYMIVQAGCTSAYGLAVNQNGNWTTVASAQLAFTCKVLNQYNVPNSLLVAEYNLTNNDSKVPCVQPDGTLTYLSPN